MSLAAVVRSNAGSERSYAVDLCRASLGTLAMSAAIIHRFDTSVIPTEEDNEDQSSVTYQGVLSLTVSTDRAP